jgi:hypothetical protein
MERLPAKLSQAAKTPPHCTFLSRRGFHTNGPIVRESDVTSLVKKGFVFVDVFLGDSSDLYR